MGFFGNKKKLEHAQIHQQRLQNELDEVKRQHEYDQEQQRQKLERQYEAQQEMQRRMIREREDHRRREDERQRAEEESRQRAQEKEERKRRLIQEREMAERKLEDDKRLRLKQASPETLRDLRELIRDRYELDVKIWGLRGARKPDHPIVEKKMDKSDAVMEEILYMVSLWGDNSDNSWTPVEWEKVNIIRKKLESGGHRNWANNPPWDDAGR